MAETLPEQIAQQGVLPRPDQYLIDRVGLDEFEDRICRIDRFEDVHRQTVIFELQRLGPVLQRDQTIDPLVVALFVQREIKGNPAELEAR